MNVKILNSMCVGCIVGPGNKGDYEKAIEELYHNKEYAVKAYQA